MPKRIQRKRTKGWKMPENTVYVGRPTKWGNPFKVGDVHRFERVYTGGYAEVTIADRAHAVWLYKRYLTIGEKMAAPFSLAGKDLACWCPLDQPCHADVLLKIANKKD